MTDQSKTRAKRKNEQRRESQEDPQKVVILGGGCAAMAAAFALTDSPELRKKYKIRVYQPGWRLGGKGASGRNSARGQRIEEHGLHVWSGYYENAFWMMRRCYALLERPLSDPLSSVFSAFVPRHYTAMIYRVREGWDFWRGYLPHETGLPGDAIHPDCYQPKEVLPPPWSLFCALIPWCLSYLQATSTGISGNQTEPISAPAWLMAFFLGESEGANPSWFDQLCEVPTSLGLLNAVYRLRQTFKECDRLHRRPAAPALIQRADDELALRLRYFQDWVHARIAKLPHKSEQAHSMFHLVDLILSLMIGVLIDGAMIHGFDRLDRMEMKDWLRHHGAQPASLMHPNVDSIYGYVFAYEGGDTQRPSLAAGVAVRLLFRLLLCSRGATFWEMQAGMGDTVFAPLFQVLKSRGVEFHFFNRALEIKTSDGQRVDEVCMGRQVNLKEGPASYEPLIDVSGVAAWPSQPLYDQVCEAKALRASMSDIPCDLESGYTDWKDVETYSLKVGQDFDHLILGISVAALPDMCKSLTAIEAGKKLKQTMQQVKTVRTQAMQLWMTWPLDKLGWRMPQPMVTALGKPFDTWADMTPVLRHEAWPGFIGPRSVQYFCGVMQDDKTTHPAGAHRAIQKAADKQVMQNATDWLNQWAVEIWSESSNKKTGKFNYSLLHARQDQRGVGRLGDQWFKANIDPSARYVQSVPGSTIYRLKADQSGFKNLALAGDWLHTGLNFGCVEAAVIGGLQAARSISGHPAAIYGEDDFAMPLDSKVHACEAAFPES